MFRPPNSPFASCTRGSCIARGLWFGGHQGPSRRRIPNRLVFVFWRFRRWIELFVLSLFSCLSFLRPWTYLMMWRGDVMSRTSAFPFGWTVTEVTVFHRSFSLGNHNVVVPIIVGATFPFVTSHWSDLTFPVPEGGLYIPCGPSILIFCRWATQPSYVFSLFENLRASFLTVRRTLLLKRSLALQSTDRLIATPTVAGSVRGPRWSLWAASGYLWFTSRAR